MALQGSPYGSKRQPDHLGPHDRYSLVSVPLRGTSGTVGMIKCENKLDDHFVPGPNLSFSADDLAVLSQLAVPVLLIGRIKSQSAQQKEAISLVMRGIRESKDWQGLLDFILRDTVRLLGANRGEFAWWKSESVEGGDLVYAALDGEITSDLVSVNGPVPKAAFIREVFNDLESDFRLIADVDVARETGVPYHQAHNLTRSEISVRVDLFANRVGVLNVESFEPNFFRAEHVPVLGA